MSIYKKNQPRVLPALESPYKKRLIEIAKLAKYEPVASIPSINNDFNYTYAKEGYLKKKQKLQVFESREQSPKPEPKHSPNPHRLPKIDSKPNKIEYHPTNSSQKQHMLTLDTRLETQDLLKGSSVRSPSPMNPPNIKNNAKAHENRARQRYRINEMQPEEEESGQDQYETDATPGPGYYSVCDNSSFLNRNRKGVTDFSFGTKDQRFKELRKASASTINQKIISQSEEKQYERRQIARRRKKIIPFLSCSFKSDSALKQKLPGPQDYHPRHGIQQELIRKIQRNFKGNFGVCEKRFSSDDKNTNLGPGSYKLDNENSQQNAESYYFKSQKKRFE